MHRVLAIALNTFRENRRDRILYVLLAFAGVLVLASLLMGQLTFTEQSKILLDLGQSSISLIGGLIAIFLGVGLVAKEIERRTVYVIVSKPVLREEFLVGKFLGLAITLGVCVVVMAVLLMGVLATHRQGPTLALLQSLVLLYVELLVVTSAALLFSSFTTTTLAAIYSVAIWLVGHVTGDILRFGSQSTSSFVQFISKVLYFTLPNLEALNAKPNATHHQALAGGEFGLAILYGLLYIGVFLFAATAVFAQRDFR